MATGPSGGLLESDDGAHSVCKQRCDAVPEALQRSQRVLRRGRESAALHMFLLALVKGAHLMTGTRLRGHAAVLAAALTALAGIAVAAPAAGASPAGSAARLAALASSAALRPVWPTPQQATQRPGALAIPDTVTEVVSAATDPAALTALGVVLHADGVQTITSVTAGNPVPAGGLVIDIGTPDGNPGIGPALAALGAAGPAGLPSGGYVLAAGHTGAGPTVVLAGVDAAGTFYAVQTLRQLITRRTLDDVVIRDWPSISLRGVIEGFYGPSWSDAEIASQLRFYGANKLNTFVYSAKDDPYLRDDWQELYPADELSALGQLVTTAQGEHVNFVYALSPGLSICYSDPSDLAELEAKDQQLWDAGVRQFALFFDDISTTFNCPADDAMFGADGTYAELAAAQAYLINEFVTGFIDTHPGAQELITVPTAYTSGDIATYAPVWQASLNPNVLVYWTGTSVVAQTITAAQAQAVAGEFGHQLVVWDNYPVNDYQPTRLFLGPLTGRAANLGTAVAGFTSNPMQEPAASSIAEFTTADYTWNSAAYDSAPDTAWTAGIASYGGLAAPALQVFADNNQSTPMIGTLPESPRLAADITAFWAAYNAGAGHAITRVLRAAAAQLTAAWLQIAAAPAVIDRLLPHPDFKAEAGPWLAKFRAYGLAGAAAVRFLLGTKAGASVSADTAALDRYYAAASGIPEVVGEGVFENFVLTADPALFSYDIRLYAADPADYQAALAAASAAGLPAGQVTDSFTTAWDETSAGEYLVIAVGGPADNALYYNVCGWTAPDGLPGGQTPFYDLTAPQDSVLPMNAYVDGAGETAPDTAALAADLAYYAVHGSLPAGVTSPPSAASPAYVCAGEPGS
jgi:hyaluronoglucosaminidase